MQTPSTVQRLAAEFLGTFWLVFAGCGSAIFAATYVTGGALTYVLYALMPVWLVAATTVMVLRLGKLAHTQAIPRTRAERYYSHLG